MQYLKVWAFVLLMIFLTACSGQSRPIVPVSANGEKADVTLHMLVSDNSGNYLPINTDLTFSDGAGRALLRENSEGKCESFAALDKHIDRMLSAFEASGKKRLLIFIHGGMNSLENSLRRVTKQYPEILGDPNDPDDGYFPVFLVWRSGIVASYFEQLCCIRGGQHNLLLGVVTMPLYLLKDTGVAIFNAPLAWGQQTYQYWTSIGDKKNIMAPETQRCDGPSKPSELRDPKSGVHFCHKGNRNTNGFSLHDGFNLIMFFPKMVTMPFVDSMGGTGWENMLRRTETLFRNPVELSNAKDTCTTEAKAFRRGSGAVSIFFKKLEERVGNGHKAHITIIGHSMGAIIINKAIESYPNIPYDNIVFMAAADNISNTIDSVGDYLQANKNTQFYNLSLHPHADAAEIAPYTFGTVPNGSLLEWVDQMFGPNRSVLDRTMGAWWNIKDALHLFPESDRVHMKVFGYNEGDPVHHIDFNNPDITTYPYWDKRFWWVEKPEAP